ncbi:hypothetical protein GGR56DRAFT_678656 [Xylariaceae sp. FL0804]|nr:hypothetical protein GGR56DRAFT_678656 [Xylariaceae sp. FL0804]
MEVMTYGRMDASKATMLMFCTYAMAEISTLPTEMGILAAFFVRIAMFHLFLSIFSGTEQAAQQSHWFLSTFASFGGSLHS